MSLGLYAFEKRSPLQRVLRVRVGIEVALDKGTNDSNEWASSWEDVSGFLGGRRLVQRNILVKRNCVLFFALAASRLPGLFFSD